MINKHSHEQSHNLLNKLQQDINNLIIKIDNQLQLPELDLRSEQIQDELAKQIVLLQRFGEYISVIQTSKRQSLAECIALQSKVYAVNLALDFLIMKKTEKITLAKNIRYSIEYFLNTKKPLGWIGNLFKRSVRELPTPTKVLIGLGMAIPVYMIAIPVSFGIVNFLAYHLDALYQNTPVGSSPSPTPTANSSDNLSKTNENIQKSPIKPQLDQNQYLLVIMVALSGAFGSIVSILIRLQDYKYKDEYVGSVTPILVGFAKPLIGTAFGIFVFALLGSGIIDFPSIQSNTSKQSDTSNKTSQYNYYFYFSIAFLVGFSERLDNDIVERVGGSFGLQKSAEKIREDVQQSREDIHQATNFVRTNAPEVKEMIEDAKQILPEVQEAVEDIKNFTPNEPVNTKSSQPNG
ncbi:hypothetical protein [Nostoc sp.]|uniref:hypothetical protein n=1 Tax=Nostoc sp. TaxID=1180 RepID=UPI002FF9C59B